MSENPRRRQLLRQPPLMRAERALRAAPRLRRVGRDHLDPEPRHRPTELGRVVPVHLAPRRRRVPVVRAPVRVQRTEQALRLDRLPRPPKAAPRALLLAEEHRIVLVGGVVHGHDQVPPLGLDPVMVAAVLMHQHARPRRALPPLAVLAASLRLRHRARPLQMVLHPAVAAPPAIAAVPGVEVPHVPALVTRPVAVHHPHHLVHRRRPVRRPRQPLVPQTVDPVLLVAARPAPERPRADTQQLARLLLRQPTLRPNRIHLFEHHLPLLLQQTRPAHSIPLRQSKPGLLVNRTLHLF